MSVKKKACISIVLIILFFSLSTSIFLYYENDNILKKIPELKNTLEVYENNYKQLQHALKTNIKSQFSYIDLNTLIIYENKTMPLSSITRGNLLLLRITSNICDCFDPLFWKILDFKKSITNIDMIILTSNKYDFRKFYSLKSENPSVKVTLLFDKISGFTADEEIIPTLVFYNRDHESFKYYSFLKNDTTMLQTFLNCVHNQIIK